jgi:hypothetical protein
MTAIPERRRRRTVVAAVTATLLTVAAGAMFVVGVVTLANSREGQAVGVDTRPREVFPATPNALLAVTDDAGALTSLVVLTLHPDGTGGSIVPLPVNADATAGFGLQRRPLNAQFDPADPESLAVAVEDMLSLTLERVSVVDPAGLAELLAPIGSVQVVLPDAVVDSDAVDPNAPVGEDAPPPGVVVSAGPQLLGPEEVAVVLTAIDESVPAQQQHPIDVAMWTAIGATAPSGPADVPTDADGAPVPPATVEELWGRLMGGAVGVRDITSAAPGAATNPTGADVVVLDRADSALVFAQISPALVSTPNPGFKVRVVSQYTDDQVAQTDGLFDSSTDVARTFIDQMLSLQNNVVSADTAAQGAPDVTLVVVTDPRRVDEVRAAAEALFGQTEVRVAETVLDGVDLDVTLGMTYLIREMVRVDLAGEAPSDGQPEGSVPTGTDGAATTDTVVVDR